MIGHSLYRRELIKGDYHPKVVAYYFRQWDDFRMPFHCHDQVEIMYVISGKCHVDTAESHIFLKKGDFILLDANVSHRLIVEKYSACRMINIEFTFTGKDGAYPSLKDLAEGNTALAVLLAKERPHLVLKDPNEVYQTLKSLVLELDEQGADHEMMVQLLFSQLLIRIARLAVAAGDVGLQQADIYVKKTIAYLHHNYDCRIQVKDIASSVNLHPGYLHRVFKSNTGCTPMEYLMTLRIEKAKMLLSHTDIPVIEISDHIGISSSQYFSTIFKKRTGKTPLEFRKSLQTSN